MVRVVISCFKLSEFSTVHQYHFQNRQDAIQEQFAGKLFADMTFRCRHQTNNFEYC